MEKIVKFSHTIRNNWKKSAVGAGALVYGATVAKEKYEINILMRAACREAAQYGDSVIPMERNPTLITVILNPVANKRSAKKDYEKYCEPLLHLAGLQVDVVQTASEGNAKEIVETLRGTEAIIVAGGDGTLSETVTGLLRRKDDATNFPLGVLPLGRTNTLGNLLFPGGEGVERVRQLIDASMAIIKGNTEWKDVLKIEQIATTEEETPRPIFAMSSIEWGAFRDTMSRKDKYWFTGGFRDYAAFIFNGYKNSITWDCAGTIKYTPPCPGCSNCLQKRPEAKRKWFFLPSTEAAIADPAKTVNPLCSQTEELCFKTSDFRIETSTAKQDVPSLCIVMGKNNYTYIDFVKDGWERLKNGNAAVETVIPARTVELVPQNTDKEVTIEIDKEEFELKSVKITVLPKIVKLFCKPTLNNV